MTTPNVIVTARLQPATRTELTIDQRIERDSLRNVNALVIDGYGNAGTLGVYSAKTKALRRECTERGTKLLRSMADTQNDEITVDRAAYVHAGAGISEETPKRTEFNELLTPEGTEGYYLATKAFFDDIAKDPRVVGTHFNETMPEKNLVTASMYTDPGSYSRCFLDVNVFNPHYLWDVNCWDHFSRQRAYVDEKKAVKFRNIVNLLTGLPRVDDWLSLERWVTGFSALEVSFNHKADLYNTYKSVRVIFTALKAQLKSIVEADAADRPKFTLVPPAVKATQGVINWMLDVSLLIFREITAAFPNNQLTLLVLAKNVKLLLLQIADDAATPQFIALQVTERSVTVVSDKPYVQKYLRVGATSIYAMVTTMLADIQLVKNDKAGTIARRQISAALDQLKLLNNNDTVNLFHTLVVKSFLFPNLKNSLLLDLIIMFTNWLFIRSTPIGFVDPFSGIPVINERCYSMPKKACLYLFRTAYQTIGLSRRRVVSSFKPWPAAQVANAMKTLAFCYVSPVRSQHASLTWGALPHSSFPFQIRFCWSSLVNWETTDRYADVSLPVNYFAEAKIALSPQFFNLSITDARDVSFETQLAVTLAKKYAIIRNVLLMNVDPPKQPELMPLYRVVTQSMDSAEDQNASNIRFKCLLVNETDVDKKQLRELGKHVSAAATKNLTPLGYFYYNQYLGELFRRVESNGLVV